MTQNKRQPWDHRIIIVGSGFAGIGMAIKLKEAGYTDFQIIERADEVGGTWRDNSYPGCECDVQSHLYSFSFEPNNDWSKKYSGHKEIHDYIKGVARKHDLYKHIRFNTSLKGATFIEDGAYWEVYTETGETITAQMVVTAVGPLSNPAMPNIKGMKKFKGESFHSATWNHDYDLKGKRVAVIGTGASAIQFVPQIAGQVDDLKLFQRTPPWVIPKPDRKFTGLEKTLFKRAPLYRRAHRASIYWMNEFFLNGFIKPESIVRSTAERIAKSYIASKIKDPVLRDKVTPDYRLGCKRVLVSNNYYPALARDNVDVLNDGIQEITKDSVIDGNGVEHKVDAIIYGTGFQVSEPLMGVSVKGLGGRDLNEEWHNNGYETYLGTTLSGYPNVFCLAGPNTGIGHTSLVFMIECQVNYAMQCIKKLDADNLAYMDVKPQAQQKFDRDLQEDMEGTVWTSGCNSWYLAESGKNFTIWPDFTYKFWLKTRRLIEEDYVMVKKAKDKQTTARNTPPLAKAS